MMYIILIVRSRCADRARLKKHLTRAMHTHVYIQNFPRIDTFTRTLNMRVHARVDTTHACMHACMHACTSYVHAAAGRLLIFKYVKLYR